MTSVLRFINRKPQIERVVAKVSCVMTKNSEVREVRLECLIVPVITCCLRAILTGNQTLHYTNQ